MINPPDAAFTSCLCGKDQVRLPHRSCAINQTCRQVPMNRRVSPLLVATAVMALVCTYAQAEELKELKTEKGKAIIIANFVAARSDCNPNPGPQPLPALREKPQHGAVGLQIAMTDVQAAGDCPARKIPSFALFYVPAADFVGIDALQIEVDTGNGKTVIAPYRITVQSTENK